VIAKGPIVRPPEGFNGRQKLPVVIISGIPLGIVLHLEGGYPVTVILKAHGRIGPEWKDIILGAVMSGGKECAHESRLREGRHGETRLFELSARLDAFKDLEPSRIRIEADGWTPGKEEKFTILRHGEKFIGMRDGWATAGISHHLEAGMIVDPPLSIGIKEVGKGRRIGSVKLLFINPGT
jgi:hypothetical protein